MNLIKLLSGLALALALSLAFAGPLAAREPIKIGVYLPLSGQMAYGGQLELDGIRLAAKEFPEVLGRPVELIVMDNKSQKIEAVSAVKTLIERDHVVGLLGSYGSSLAIAGGEIIEEARIPAIGTSPTSPLVTQGKKYYFRACFTDISQSAGAAAYAYNTLGARRAAVLPDVSSDMSVGQSAFFKRAFTRLGGKIVAEMHFNAGDQDFTFQLTEIMSQKPDVLFIPAYCPEGVAILRQAQALGAGFRIMGGDSMDNPELVSIGGPAANGFIHTTFPYDPDMADPSPEARALTELWRANHPDRPANGSIALGYTAYLMMIEGIKRAGKVHPEAITAALNTTKGLRTPVGVLTLDRDHNPRMAVGLIEIIDGRRTYLGEIQPE